MTDEKETMRKQARRVYAAQYRERNREKIRAYDRAWREAHPGKSKEYQDRFWDRQAQKLQAQEDSLDD